MTNLMELKKGFKAKIISINDESDTKMKLYSLGVLEGDTLELTNVALLGSPIALKHGNGNFFALRKEEALQIEVEILS